MRNNMNYGSRFREYLKGNRGFIAILVIFSLMLAGLSLVFPVIWANILVKITISASDYMSFVKYIIIYVALELIEGIIKIIKNFVYSTMEEKVTNEIKKDLFNKILTLETKAFDRNRISFFTTKVTEDPHTLIASFFKIINMVITFIKAAAIVGLAFTLCFDVGVIFAAAFIVIYLTTTKIKPFMAKGSRILSSQVKDYTASLYENVRNIREVKSLGAKDVLKNKFEEETTEVGKKITSSKNLENLMELLMFTIKFSIHSLVLIVTTYYFFADVITFDAIIILELYSAILYNAARQFAEVKSVWLSYKNSLKSIFDVLTNKNYTSEKFGNVETVNGEGYLTVKNLSFEFGNRKMILDDINFEIEKNSKVAIVDKGGNSKQVLLKLLLRQYEPTEGRIMIDDVNIRDFSEHALRKTIMLVSEKPFILNDTLEKNIRLVKPNASIEDVVDVCKKTDILSWFDDETLGDIMTTRLGDGGMELTEPQKQLIAIARVLLVKPQVVIIEEAQNDFSADDTFSIKNALDKITDSTVLIFSERISSISVCDKIITLSPAKFGAASVTMDVIRERNLYGFVNKKNNTNTKYVVSDDEQLSNESNNNDDIEIDTEMNDIKKLNMRKGAKKNNEEHRIFSQIW